MNNEFNFLRRVCSTLLFSRNRRIEVSLDLRLSILLLFFIPLYMIPELDQPILFFLSFFQEWLPGIVAEDSFLIAQQARSKLGIQVSGIVDIDR